MTDLQSPAVPQAYVPKPRNSNLELYRILTMFFIIIHHYVVNSGLPEVMLAEPASPRSLYCLLIGAWGKTVISCFVFITGWFMCKSHITIQKFVRLYAVLYFYSILFYLIFLCCGRETFSFERILELILPFTLLGNDNFISCYMTFFLLIPFLNILLKNMTKRQHGLLLILCLTVFTVFALNPGYKIVYNYVSWFSVLFMLAAYLRNYPVKRLDSLKFTGTATVICIALGAGSVIARACWAQYHRPEALDYSYIYYYVADSNTLLALLTGVFSFMFFKNLPVPQSRIINTVATTIFGVLCIHANSSAMRKFLWCDTFDSAGHYGCGHYILYPIGVVLLVYAACILLDLVRLKLIEPPFMRFMQKHVFSRF